MSSSTLLYGQLFALLRQHSRASDLRHLKTLAWMVSALLYSGQLSLPAWEPYIQSRATKAQSLERRWRRFLDNQRVRVSRMYVPLVMAALSGSLAPSSVSGSRYHSLMGAILHDSLVGGVLWSCRALAVASPGAWQCDRCL